MTRLLLLATLCVSGAFAQVDPCDPNPCGPNTDCSAESAGVAKCRCRPGFFPKPDTITGCGPQCSADNECRENQICAANKCVNPCDQNICGIDAVCEVKIHRTLCKCPGGTTGDPFTKCAKEREASQPRAFVANNDFDDNAGRILTGGPRPSSFSSNRDSFSNNRDSFSNNRDSFSNNRDSFSNRDNRDNSFSSRDSSSSSRDSVRIGGGSSNSGSSNRLRDSFGSGSSRQGNDCTAQCGTNARCVFRGLLPVCSCDAGSSGDPYRGCQRGECQENDDCPSNRVCFELKCIDPCPTTCGVNSDCSVRNHVTSCRCPNGYSGDPFTSCTRNSAKNANSRGANDRAVNICSPTPCGPNTDCRADGNQAICSCLSGYIGDPIVGCRRECEADFDCDNSLACVEFRCQDPCITRCGRNADCRVSNQRAVCSCPTNYLGDPYSECRPECIRHDDCPANKACFNLKCVDPCQGACGQGADCRVNNHKAICSCPKGYTGHPFDRCRPFAKEDLCNPNPCGTDALCKPGVDRDNNQRPVCLCRDGYIGDPLVECRRGDCIEHEDCDGPKACYGFKCVDPCVSQTSGGGVCGLGARCDARNHGAVCSCPSGTSGDPLSECRTSNQRLRNKRK